MTTTKSSTSQQGRPRRQRLVAALPVASIPTVVPPASIPTVVPPASSPTVAPPASIPAIPPPASIMIPPPASIPAVGTSFVMKFSEMKVNAAGSPAGTPSGVSYAGRTTRSAIRGATPTSGSSTRPTTRATTRGATPSSGFSASPTTPYASRRATSPLSPLSSAPSTPPATPTFCTTPVVSRGRPRLALGDVVSTLDICRPTCRRSCLL